MSTESHETHMRVQENLGGSSVLYNRDSGVSYRP